MAFRDEKSISGKWDEARERVKTAEERLRSAERDVQRYTDELAKAREAEKAAWAELEGLRSTVVR